VSDLNETQSPVADERPSRNAVTRVGLVAKHHLRAASGVLAEVAGFLDARGVHAVFEADTAVLAGVPTGRATAPRDDLPKQVDLIVVLGGDGTLLGMADRIAQAGVDVPILGVNFGSLGFLTEVTLADIQPALEAALGGNGPIDERLMLRGRVMRGRNVQADRIALNDIVVTRGALSRIIALSVSVGDEFVTSVRADGLIVASPTGSTAYNLAAGGPIVHPAVDALVLTPIAPHMLTNRPVVIPAGTSVRIAPIVAERPPGAQDDPSLEILATFDGQFGVPLEKDDVLIVSRAERPLRLVRGTSRTYFEVLREKLKWGER
jgi:NAD+ kinase